MVYSAQNNLNTQRRVSDPEIARPGQAVLDQLNVAFLNAAAETAQTILIDIGTAVADTDYTVTINGVAVSTQYVVADGDTYNNVAGGTAITDTIMRDRLASFLERYQSTYEVARTGAAQITLTHVVLGVNNAVTVSGGGAGFAVNTDTPANVSAHIDFGVVVTQAGTFNDENGPLGQLPSAAGQRVLGIARRSHAHERVWQSTAAVTGISQDGIRPRSEGTAMKQGIIYARAATTFTGTETGVFFVNTGATAGQVANATAGDRDALANSSVHGPSVTLEDGVIVVPIQLNMP